MVLLNHFHFISGTDCKWKTFQRCSYFCSHLILNNLFFIFFNTFNLIYGFQEICESKGKPTSYSCITYKLFPPFSVIPSWKKTGRFILSLCYWHFLNFQMCKFEYLQIQKLVKGEMLNFCPSSGIKQKIVMFSIVFTPLVKAFAFTRLEHLFSSAY